MTGIPQRDAAQERFGAIVARHAGTPGVGTGVSWGGTPDLRVHDKIFAMLSRGELVVKLPEARVDDLVADGTGSRFDPRRNGRLMREWATVPMGRAEIWDALADDALAFVRAVAERGR